MTYCLIWSIILFLCHSQKKKSFSTWHTIFGFQLFFKQILPYYESWYKEVTIVESSTARDSIYLESVPCILINCSARFLRNNVHSSVLLRKGQTRLVHPFSQNLRVYFGWSAAFACFVRKTESLFTVRGVWAEDHHRNIASDMFIDGSRDGTAISLTNLVLQHVIDSDVIVPGKKKSRRQLYRNQTTKNAVFEFHLLMIRLPNLLGWEVCKSSWP